jgi:glycosyltransferase involved in cell wall biosynthesis
MPSLRYVDTVHNAVDVRGYPFRTDKEDFALTIGRVCADKAQHLAIKAARAAGMRILLAGKIDPGADFVYFQTMVEPLLGDDAEYLGEVPEARKRELMARARCFLFPIQWAEPFGLVMAEAMAAGTPVIATRNGAVPEVVIDRVTGFIVDDTEEMIERLLRIDEIDPGACRAHVEATFSPERMAAGYERNYETIARKTAEPVPDDSPGRRVTTQGRPAYASLCGSVSKSASAPARAGGARFVGGHRDRYRRDNLPDSPRAG